ncbi:trypsin-like [Toxorhynchites rutilus septentrionalis]|uniref:trypsin-like n=1 Tax=Toxorhynchites rutilus septentrionalis TaxID=329112 RepID=UPI00247A89DF|nr:trypsin-like [Toxorhynchites rutilus septentrionalis]
MFRISLLVVLTGTVVVLGSTLPETFLQENGRIVGGNDTAPGQFPYIASLRTLSNSHFCGASILTEQWLLSAAHCTLDRQPGGVSVVVGSHTLNRGDHHRVARIVNHPSFDRTVSTGNDISVIRTASMMIFTIVVQPIALTEENVDIAEGAIVAGWGTTSEEGAFTNIMQWKFTKIITLDECRQQFSEQLAGLVTAGHICTTNEQDRAVCSGDSGGPLVLGGRVHGIVSWSVGCNSRTPDVYTRVWSYRRWIEDSMAS